MININGWKKKVSLCVQFSEHTFCSRFFFSDWKLPYTQKDTVRNIEFSLPEAVNKPTVFGLYCPNVQVPTHERHKSLCSLIFAVREQKREKALSILALLTFFLLIFFSETYILSNWFYPLWREEADSSYLKRYKTKACKGHWVSLHSFYTI